MSDIKNTQPQEVKTEEQEKKPDQKEVGASTEQPKETPKETPSDEKPVGEQMGTVIKKTPESVPFEVFKALKKDMKELKQKLEEKDNQNQAIEVTDLETLAKKYNVNQSFLNELATTIDKKNAEKYEKRLEGIEAENASVKIERAFSDGFKKAMKNLPEFKGIVNPNVIKTLSMDPSNSNKTFTQLIKETYGSALPGKSSLESTKPGSREADTSVDFDKAKKDPVYFKEVMADPAKKKAYNENLVKTIRI